MQILALKRSKQTVTALTILVLALSCLAFPFKASASLTDGLVGHWKLDENSGTVASDSSGSNNHGTLAGGPTWVPGISGSALHFDGSGMTGAASNTVNAGNNPSLNGIIDYTLSFWVKFDPGYVGNGGPWANLIGKTQGYDFSFMMYVNSAGHIRAHHTQSNGTYVLVDSTAPVPTGEWLQIAQVADGDHIRLYINGVEAAPAGAYDGTALDIPGANTYIGQDTRENTLIGSIDEVRIYNRGIEPEEAEDIGEQFEAVDITTTSLAGGTVGTPYTQTVTAAGGQPPYEWSVSSGNLPSGLSLNTSTGVISGTPLTETTSSFTISAEDSVGVIDSQLLEIDVQNPPAYDGDNDGIHDSIEDAAPNDGDANNDGTDDSDQDNVSSFVNPVNNQYTVVEVSNTCAITTASNKAESANAVSDSGFNYPLGLMNFTAACGIPGFTTNVSLYYFGTPTDSMVLRKYNPNTNAYFMISDAQLTTLTINAKAAIKTTYQVTDGGLLDTDGSANGTIVDPAGLAISAVGVPNTGLGGLY